jgi:hypothetical protein
MVRQLPLFAADWNDRWHTLLRPILENICGSDVSLEPTIADLAQFVLRISDETEVARMRKATAWLARKAVSSEHERWQSALTMFQMHGVGLQRHPECVEEYQWCKSYVLFLAEETPVSSLTLTQLAVLICLARGSRHSRFD